MWCVVIVIFMFSDRATWHTQTVCDSISTFAITVNTNQSLVIHKSNIFRNEYVNVTALHKFSLNCYRIISRFSSLSFVYFFIFCGSPNIKHKCGNLKPERGEWGLAERRTVHPTNPNQATKRNDECCDCELPLIHPFNRLHGVWFFLLLSGSYFRGYDGTKNQINNDSVVFIWHDDTCYMKWYSHCDLHADCVSVQDGWWY